MSRKPTATVVPRPLPYVSLAIIAWNEEKVIAATLGSIFQQSFFDELSRRGLHCEILCVVNGCTDQTPEIAQRTMAEQTRTHPASDAFSCRVISLEQRGKLKAWNACVHSLSHRDARFLFFIDADIRLQPRETLWNMLLTLENHSEASVATDRPCKDLSFKSRKSVRDRLSLGASEITHSAGAQLCGQLYCIRREIARNIYLPKDLSACEDGFIKALVCTDFLEHPVRPGRIRVAPGAGHTFEAYTSPVSILKNQKRQAIGQTIVHILVDQYLPTLSSAARLKLAETLRNKDEEDPDWLKLLIREHLQRIRFFWRLYPGLVAHRFKRLAKLGPGKRTLFFPVAVAGTLVTLAAAFLAFRTLKAGSTDYWPKADRKPTDELAWPQSHAFQFHHKTQQE